MTIATPLGLLGSDMRLSFTQQLSAPTGERDSRARALLAHQHGRAGLALCIANPDVTLVPLLAGLGTSG